MQYYVHAATAKSLQSCPTLCDPMDCSLPGSSVHGICQARVLEWGAITFSMQYSVNITFICTGKQQQKNCVTHFIAIFTLLRWSGTWNQTYIQYVKVMPIFGEVVELNFSKMTIQKNTHYPRVSSPTFNFIESNAGFNHHLYLSCLTFMFPKASSKLVPFLERQKNK